jgi:hypothetical protein
MPGRFYSDLLSGADSRLGVDWTKDAVARPAGFLHPSAGEPFKDSVYAFKTAPKKTVSMEVSKSSEGELKGTSRAVTEKTAAKIKVSHDGLTSAWGFANDKFTADLSGKYADKDYPMDWAIKTESKPAKSEWKAKLLWDVQTPDMSGAKLYQNVEVEHNSKKEWKVTSKTSIDYQGDYTVGAHVEHDTKDFQKLRFQSTCDPDCAVYNGTFWGRVDVKSEYAGAGCDNKLKDGIRHSWEALYSWKEGYKGFQGQPVRVLGGVAYDLSDNTSMTVTGEAGEDYLLKANQTHKLDKNWTLGVSQRFDSSRLSKDGVSPYDIGFSMTYKL